MATITKRTGPRGEYAKTEQRRTEILSAALEVISSAGFHKASLRDVAARAGLSQAGLLHHFPNRGALLMGVLEWRDTIDRQRFHGVAGGVSVLRALVDLVEQNQTVPNVVELFVTVAVEATSPQHPAHAYFRGRYAWAVDTVTKALRQAESVGELRPGVLPDSAARQLLALIDGLQVQWLYDRSSVDMVAELRSHLRGVLVVDL
ncbi:TetR/AcrR family transcriptional regulator [Streptomyces sp. NPDC013978]|uniref:TetR/AcrR family transcriptional regulator n=1 Tax=Streptomyces sp. NPDC013978 TaxID=3364869 RepID=UPI0036FBB55B